MSYCCENHHEQQSSRTTTRTQIQKKQRRQHVNDRYTSSAHTHTTKSSFSAPHNRNLNSPASSSNSNQEPEYTYPPSTTIKLQTRQAARSSPQHPTAVRSWCVRRKRLTALPGHRRRVGPPAMQPLLNIKARLVCSSCRAGAVSSRRAFVGCFDISPSLLLYSSYGEACEPSRFQVPLCCLGAGGVTSTSSCLSEFLPWCDGEP